VKIGNAKFWAAVPAPRLVAGQIDLSIPRPYDLPATGGGNGHACAQRTGPYVRSGLAVIVSLGGERMASTARA
jgi:hypothetical protein